jgi:hypothetical protein
LLNHRSSAIRSVSPAQSQAILTQRLGVIGRATENRRTHPSADDAKMLEEMSGRS